MAKLVFIMVLIFSLSLLFSISCTCGGDDDDDDSSDPQFEEDDDDDKGNGNWKDCSEEAALSFYECKDKCPPEPSCQTPPGEYCDHYYCVSECYEGQDDTMILCGEIYEDPDARVDFWECDKACQQEYQSCLEPLDECNEDIYMACLEDKIQCQSICQGL